MNDSQKDCETTTEWAVHWPAEGSELKLCADEAEARELARMYSTGAAVVVSRQVTRSPWTEVPS